jgi:protein ImuB
MFAALILPQFQLQAASRWREVSDAAVVVDDVGAKGVVLDVSDIAAAKGISAGMSSAQAMARDMRVRILARSPEQESALTELLIESALTLSADVENTSESVCIADLRARPKPPCWQALGDELIGRFRHETLKLVVGLAPTPDLAVLAARGTSGVSVIYDCAAFVRALHVRALEPSAGLADRFHDWGVATVGDLLALPKADVIERLGKEAADLLRKVSGRHKRPLRLVRPVARYVEAFDFEHEVETTEPLLFLLRRFLGSLCERLRAAYLVAQRMLLRVPLENGSAYERSFSIPAPSTDVEVLYRILDTHLESLRLEHRPVALRLEIEPAKSGGNQLHLFETALRDLNGFGETLARLKALLGEDCVGVPRKLDIHRPDAFTLDECFPEEPAPSGDEPARGIPLRKFRPAVPAEVETADGRPVGLQSAIARGAITQRVGPFRLSGDWWDVECWHIEEWDVELCEGGMFRLSRSREGWRLEGAYELR